MYLPRCHERLLAPARATARERSRPRSFASGAQVGLVLWVRLDAADEVRFGGVHLRMQVSSAARDPNSSLVIHWLELTDTLIPIHWLRLADSDSLIPIHRF